MTETENIKPKRNYATVVKTALDIGELMHISGGEVSRVEDTVSRICYAYGVERVDVLTITSSIIVTVLVPDGDPITQTRRISSQSRDMTRLDALNRLSREICETLPDIETVVKRLDEIKRQKGLRWYYSLIAMILSASGFTVFFGGSWRDALATAAVAVMIFACVGLHSYIRVNKIVYFLLTSFLAGAVSVASVHIGLGMNVNAIMIGAIMILIPGVTFTSAFEDLLSGDTITGLLQLCESVLVAVAIAVGFALATFVCGGYDMLDDGTGQINAYVQLIAAIISSGGFAMMFGVKKPKRLLAASLGAGLTQGIFMLLDRVSPLSIYFCLLIATAFGAAYSQIMARIMRAPATVFTLPIIIPLVPGSALYYAMSWALRGNADKFSEWGIATLLYALFIATGLVLVLAATGGITAIVRRSKLRKTGSRR